MTKRLGMAIIGCGRISQKHIEAIITNQQDAELIAVSDLISSKMAKALNFYYEYLKKKNSSFTVKKIKQYQNYKDLLMDNEIDIVTIATESGYHARITYDALNAGKHVIVEKPMALSTADADKMISLAAEKKLKLAVCHQNRFNPTVKRLRKTFTAGKMGKIVHAVASIRWQRSADYYLMDNWHGTLALDGGVLINQCLHCIDLLAWMLGDVKHLYAETDTFLHQIETEDAGFSVIRFKNGAIGLVEGSVCIYPKNLEETFSIFAEKGTVRLGGIAMNKIINWKIANGKNKEEIIKEVNYDTDSVYGYGHNLLFQDVIKAIRKNRKPLVDGIEGKKTIELILGIYKSAYSGNKVCFPLGNYSIADLFKFLPN